MPEPRDSAKVEASGGYFRLLSFFPVCNSVRLGGGRRTVDFENEPGRPLLLPAAGRARDGAGAGGEASARRACPCPARAPLSRHGRERCRQAFSRAASASRDILEDRMN